MCSNEELRVEIRAVKETMDRIEVYLQRTDERMEKRINRNADRLDGLENSRNRQRGAIGAILFVLGAVGMERLVEYFTR